jgi:hypothetical protein
MDERTNRQTDRQTDRQRNTLAAHGLEELRVNLLLKENSYVSYIILESFFLPAGKSARI